MSLLVLFCSEQARATGEVPPTFTLNGQLYDSPAGTNPLVDPSVQVRIQVLNPAKTCVVYDETQVVDTSTSGGEFNVLVGSLMGAGKRTFGSDPGNTMVDVFQNVQAMLATGCAGNAYTPALGDIRYVRLIITPSTTGTTDTLSPDMEMGSVPTALDAERAENLQGLSRSQVLQIGTVPNLTQANEETVFSNTNYPVLMNLLAGTSTEYVKSGTGGAGLPSVAAAPGTTAAGDIWYNSTTGMLQYSDGTATPITVGTSTTGVSSVAVSSPITNSGSATAPNIGIQASSGTQSGYLSNTDWTTFNGKLSTALPLGDIFVGNGAGAATAVAVSGDITLSTAGVTSVSKIQGTSVSNSAPTTDGEVLRYNLAGTDYIPAYLGVLDIRSTKPGSAQFFPTTCTNTQTLVYNAATDTMACTSVAISSFSGSLAGDVSGTQAATVVSLVGGSTAANVHAAELLANAATSTNTVSTIVKRDPSGAFSAGAATLSSAVISGNETVSGNTTYKDSGANTVSLAAPSAVTTSYALSLPIVQGGSNQMMVNNGSGQLSWASLSSLGVSSVAVSSPITNSGSASAPNIGIQGSSGTQSGYLSNTDWTTFNGKLGTALPLGDIFIGNGAGAAVAVAVSGDITLSNAGVTAVAKIQGTPVSSTAPGTGQFFEYNGTNWAGKNINLADLKSTSAGTPALFSSPNCAANQTLSWSAVTDQFTCISITSLDGATITTGTIAAARLPASASAWSVSGSNVYISTGNVGVDTASPTNALSFSGQSPQEVWMERETTAATAGNNLMMQAGGGESGGTNLSGGNLVLSGGIATGNGTSQIQLQTAGGGSTGSTDKAPTTQMTILGNGNVGVNQVAPVEKLDVSGNVRVNGGQVYTAAQIGTATATLTFDVNSGNIMIWNPTTTGSTATVNLYDVKAGGSYTLIVRDTATTALTFNCYAGTQTTPGMALTNSFMPANGSRSTNASFYNVISDGTYCYVVWMTGMT